MPADAPNIPSTWSMFVFLAVGGAFLLVAFIMQRLYAAEFLGAILFAFGAAVLGSLVTFTLGWFVPKREPDLSNVEGGHHDIYKEYRKCLGLVAADETLTIRATSSLPHEGRALREWDAFLTSFLRTHPHVTYHRALITQKDSKRWAERKKEIFDRYRDLPNYKQYVVEGPPSIEFLLVDTTVGFLSFASTAEHVETRGIVVRNRKLLKDLDAYFQHHLMGAPDSLSEMHEDGTRAPASVGG